MDEDNPFKNLPVDFERYAEQAFAEANLRLDAIVVDMRAGIDKREKQYGVVSDASTYIALRDWIQLHMISQGPLVAAVVCAAAIFRLAREPQKADPLEAVWNLPADGGQEGQK